VELIRRERNLDGNFLAWSRLAVRSRIRLAVYDRRSAGVSVSRTNDCCFRADLCLLRRICLVLALRMSMVSTRLGDKAHDSIAHRMIGANSGVSDICLIG